MHGRVAHRARMPAGDESAASRARVPAAQPLVPCGWLEIEGLVCGFGDRELQAPAGTRLLRRQVHGTHVVDASREGVRPAEDDSDDFPRVHAEADALVAAQPGLVVGVRTADCVPLLLVAPHRRWAAAVHAGWRGTLAGIATEALRAARDAGIRPEDMLAALGPSIGPCCYEVSEELGSHFERAGLPVALPPAATSSSRPHLDLRAANRVLLEGSGIPVRNIQTIGPCTRCARDRYHSFRADADEAGRQVSWVGWADRTHARDRAPTR